MRRHSSGFGPPTAHTCGRRARPVLSTFAVVAIGAFALAGCGGDSSAASDPAATRALSKAASAMLQASGYRFAATVGNAPAQVQLGGEFQAPDRVHETITVTGKAPGEVVFIGRNAFVRDPATGKWRNRVKSTSSNSTDVRSSFAALTHAKGVTRSGATYHFTVPASAAQALVGSSVTGTVAASARVSNGQIDTLTYRATVSGRVVEVRIVFTDVNNAPAVAQPSVA